MSSFSSSTDDKKYIIPLIGISFAFFIWGFLTSLNDILIPHLKVMFQLNYAHALLIQFTFFSTYAILSIPMSFLLNKIQYKKSIILGFSIAACGCLIFIPAIYKLIYVFFLGGLFVLAAGITLLQVAANPYASILGSKETSSSRLTLMQALNSLGTTLGPLFGSAFILQATSNINSIQYPYYLLAGILIFVAIAFIFVPMPNFTQKESHITHFKKEKTSIWQHSHLIYGCLTIFVYVGAEVGIGSFIVSYIQSFHLPNLSKSDAGNYVALYWGGAMIGRFIGAFILQFIKPSQALIYNGLINIILLTISIYSSGYVAIYSLLAIGLFNSIMFPTIFALAIAETGQYMKRASGMLCVAIAGGAIIPLLEAIIADQCSIQVSFLLPILCYATIIFYGFRGYKIK